MPPERVQGPTRLARRHVQRRVGVFLLRQAGGVSVWIEENRIFGARLSAESLLEGRQLLLNHASKLGTNFDGFLLQETSRHPVSHRRAVPIAERIQ